MKKILLTAIGSLSLFSPTVFAKDFSPASQLYFVENKGQITDQFGLPRKDIQYVLHAKGLDVFIGRDAIHYQFTKPAKEGKVESYRLDVALEGASPSAGISAEFLPENIQYRTAATPEMVTARTASKIVYKDVYPGIDRVIYVKDGKLEYDFIVNEGASAAIIKQGYNGASSLNIPKGGGLEIKTPFGSVTEQTPVAYQEDGKKIGSAFRQAGKSVSFTLEDYEGKLTIDPVIEWATYYGGTGGDVIYDVAVDASGNVYACGETESTSNIATVGAHQQTHGTGLTDAFIAKFNSIGGLQWATYYGDTGIENLNAITCDANGNVFAGGRTTSGNIDAGVVHQSVMYGSSDAFLMKLTSNGQLLFCTYYGGYSSENGVDVKCDANNNVFLSGTTNSGNFIGTTGTHQAFQFGGSQGFLVKFDNAGVRQWGTYFGGTTDESGSGIAIDSAGYIYMVGNSQSNDYISTTGAFQTVPQGGTSDGYLAKFRNNNGQLSWATYIGDTDVDGARGVATGPGYSVYVTGYTQSGTVLHTVGTQQQAYSGLGDCYLLRFDSAGNRIWGTYYGGTQYDEPADVECAPDGSIWIAGQTGSTTVIATVDGHQAALAGNVDGFFAKFDNAGMRTWGSYYGEIDDDGANALAFYSSAVYLGGQTYGPGALSTTGAHQVVSGGFDDGFVAKFIECTVPAITALSATTFCQGDSVILAGPVGSGYTYQWMLNGANINGATDTTYTAIGGGNYSLALTTTACGLDTSFTIQVTVNPLPVPVITNVGTTLNTGSFSSYQWNLNGNPISGATSQSYSASQGGPYTVTVTDGNGCVGTSAPITLSVTTVQNNSEGLLVYPNPNNGTFTIKANLQGREKEALLTITDIAGRNLASQNVAVKNGVVDSEVNLAADLAPGIYLLKLSAGGKSAVVSFVKK